MKPELLLKQLLQYYDLRYEKHFISDCTAEDIDLVVISTRHNTSANMYGADVFRASVIDGKISCIDVIGEGVTKLKRCQVFNSRYATDDFYNDMIVITKLLYESNDLHTIC